MFLNWLGLCLSGGRASDTSSARYVPEELPGDFEPRTNRVRYAYTHVTQQTCLHCIHWQVGSVVIGQFACEEEGKCFENMFLCTCCVS